MNKIKKWFKEYDPSNTQERAFILQIREGKSLKALIAVLNAFGLQRVSKRTVTRYIDSLDPEIGQIWRSQRPQNRLLRKLRKIIPTQPTEQIDENAERCPNCHRILESSTVHIRLERAFDMNRECEVLKCPYCHHVIQFNEANVKDVSQWSREIIRERNRDLYGF